MPEITHQPEDGRLRQIITAERLTEILLADGDTLDRPSDFGPRDEWHVAAETTSYRYATDSETGTIEASDFAAACRQLDAMLTTDAILNGGWGWVEDVDGDRYEVGIR